MLSRADKAKAIVMFEELATALRTELYGEAAAEHAQGSTPSWRMGDVTVSSSLSNPTAVIDDPAAFLAYVQDAHPSEVETIVTETTQVRPQFARELMKWIAKAGEECDRDGRVVPGVRYVPGGELRSISVKPTTDFKADATQFALEVAAGQRHLALPAIGDEATDGHPLIEASPLDDTAAQFDDPWHLPGFSADPSAWTAGSAVTE